MGRTKENPRYNVISLRVSDAELARIKASLAADERIGDYVRDSALFIATFRDQNRGLARRKRR